MDHKHRINPVYRILFLPLISIDDIVFSHKNLIKKALALVFPTILLFIWGILWTIFIGFGVRLLGISFFEPTYKLVSLVTIIWALIFILIPIIRKQKKLTIPYSAVLIFVLLFFINEFILGTKIVDGHSMEPLIKDGSRVYIYRLSDYRINDIVIYADPENTDIERIGRIISLPKHIYSSDEPSGYVVQADDKNTKIRTVPESNIAGRVINYK